MGRLHPRSLCVRPGRECWVFKCTPGCTRHSHPGVECLAVVSRVFARVPTRVRVSGFGPQVPTHTLPEWTLANTRVFRRKYVNPTSDSEWSSSSDEDAMDVDEGDDLSEEEVFMDAGWEEEEDEEEGGDGEPIVINDDDSLDEE